MIDKSSVNYDFRKSLLKISLDLFIQGRTIECNCGKDFCVSCGADPLQCQCELGKSAHGGNRSPLGSTDFEEETALYKMIMKDQEDEIAKMKGK